MMKDRGRDRDRDRDRDRERERERERGRDFLESIIHDAEFGEENVEQVDEEWADFEKVLR